MDERPIPGVGDRRASVLVRDDRVPPRRLDAADGRDTWIILPPVACYLLLGMPNVSQLVAVFGQPSPESLAVVMAEPWAASMFWAYAGAFDLFVGRWMFLDARERGMGPLWVSPVLFVTIFFGPLGFLLYGGACLARVARGARVSPS